MNILPQKANNDLGCDLAHLAALALPGFYRSLSPRFYCFLNSAYCNDGHRSTGNLGYPGGRVGESLFPFGRCEDILLNLYRNYHGNNDPLVYPG